MNTLKAISFTLVGSAAVLSLPATSTAAEHHQAVKQFSITEVTNNINLLQGKGGNIAVLSGDQGMLMIDDDYKVMSEALEEKLSEMGGANQVKYLINTHWHGDHTEGNYMMGQWATIVAHDNVRARLMNAQEIKLFGMKSEPYPKHALPSITYQSAMHLHFNNEDIELLHLANGHTDGDTVVFFKKANVVHMGDHFFNGFYPFVDTQNGGNVLSMAENVSSILEMIDDETKVIPGHGPLSNKAELTAFRDMLVGTAEEIKMLKEAGKSLSEIQATHAGNEKWKEWQDGFIAPDVWVSIVLASLE